MLDSIPVLIEELKQGRMIILVDAPDRENEGDLVMAGQLVTPAAVNFMITHGRGLVCMPLTQERAHLLGLTLMVPDNQSLYKTAFTQSIGAAVGITTGISAHDRAKTIQVAASAYPKKGDICSPGHIFPLIAHEKGLAGRRGHTEGALELLKLTENLRPVAVICEILSENGQPARLPELKRFAKKHGLKLGCIEDILSWKKKHLVEPGGIEPPTS